jgi:aldo/keto reductase family protein
VTCITSRPAVSMIRYAIEQGVNYVDTAYIYHDENSEVVVGKALEDGIACRVAMDSTFHAISTCSMTRVSTRICPDLVSCTATFSPRPNMRPDANNVGTAKPCARRTSVVSGHGLSRAGKLSHVLKSFHIRRYHWLQPGRP